MTAAIVAAYEGMSSLASLLRYPYTGFDAIVDAAETAVNGDYTKSAASILFTKWRSPSEVKNNCQQRNYELLVWEEAIESFANRGSNQTDSDFFAVPPLFSIPAISLYSHPSHLQLHQQGILC